MGDKTGISWTDASWNPIRGCTRISEGCRHCYAERHAGRFSGKGKPYEGLITIKPRRQMQVDSAGEPTGKFRSLGNRAYWNGEVRFVTEHLADPLRWKKPRRIFVNSMSDLFHEKLSNEQIAAIFGVMAAARLHTFQVLTKRAKRMREWFEWRAKAGDITDLVDEKTRTLIERSNSLNLNEHETVHWPLPNAWLGVSVENQAAADERIPELLATPAAVRFLSCEPLLGPVDLDQPLCDRFDRHGSAGYTLADDEAAPWCSECEAERSYGHWLHLDGGIDWVIAGCESGPSARPCEVDWLRSLRDQCAAAGVSFFLKQAREDMSVSSADKHGRTVMRMGPGSKLKQGGIIELPYLDGIQHAAFPEVSNEG